MAAVVLACVAAHARLAHVRSHGLLEHDESISLLMAAGQAQNCEALYHATSPITTLKAVDMQAWLRPGPDTGLADVVRSLSRHDIHPPLYFSLIHLLQKAGISSQTLLRLAGTVALALAVMAANRWLWAGASTWVRCAASAWLMLAPASLEIGTEIRQYALVVLGLVLAQAAISAHWSEHGSGRGVIALLATAPVLLLWSQLGTAIWILAALPLALAPCIRRQPAATRRLATAAAVAGLFVCPVIAWKIWLVTPPPPFPPIPPEDFGELVIQRSLRNAGSALVSLPWRWRQGAAPQIIGALGLIGLTALSLVQLRGAVRWLWATALAWLAGWFALMALAVIPHHATHAEHLQPLLLVIPLVLAAVATTAPRVRIRRLAAAVLAASAASHVLGFWQMLDARAEPTAVAELRAADHILVTAPRRGFLLPVIAPLRPDAAVHIGSPAAALAAWGTSPPAAKKFILVDVTADGPAPGREAFIAHMRRHYGEMEVVRDEPVRKLIAFRRPRENRAGE